MDDKPSPDVFEQASNAWQAAMNEKDFRKAIRVGIEAYLHYQREGDERISDGALNLIYVAISQIVEADDAAIAANSCSFCGRSGSEVRLGVGAEAFICADCVEIFHEHFRGEAPA